MFQIRPLQPIDYLLIGHVTVDQTPDGPRLGGTVSYAGLMARALGLRVGIVTACGPDAPLELLDGLPVASYPGEYSTTFKNVYTEAGRVQTLIHTAPNLDYHNVPDAWRDAPIVHLGPVAQEVEPGLVRNFPSALIGVTPQGWMRAWDRDGKVRPTEWPEQAFVLERCGAAVISLEDVGGDESRIEEMAASCHVLVVTENSLGCRLFWNGDVRRFRAPEVDEVDATGAGDVFATSFFVRLFETRDPWEAARFATHLASVSVTRRYLAGIPTKAEIDSVRVEVF
jgi:sugar/nucleoside kinase (ribokinase family)